MMMGHNEHRILRVLNENFVKQYVFGVRLNNVKLGQTHTNSQTSHRGHILVGIIVFLAFCQNNHQKRRKEKKNHHARAARPLPSQPDSPTRFRNFLPAKTVTNVPKLQLCLLKSIC